MIMGNVYPGSVNVSVVVIHYNDATIHPVKCAKKEVSSNTDTMSPMKPMTGENRVTLERCPVHRLIMPPAPVSINHPCIVIRHINNFSARRLNDDLVILSSY